MSLNGVFLATSCEIPPRQHELLNALIVQYQVKS